jgi:hypothetical protein
MQIGWHFFEGEIVIAVAVCAARFIEMLSFGLLRCEVW